MAELLDDATIESELQSRPGWLRDDDTILRTFERRDWNDAIALVNAVAPEAEARNHHPDVSITGYRMVTFRLTTHSAGGITWRDLDLASRIDQLAGSHPGAESKRRAIREATTHAYPTGDMDKLLVDVERGYADPHD